MTTPTVPPTSDPAEVPERSVPPESRPEPTPADECLPSGTMRYSATPCDPTTGNLLPVVGDDCLSIDSVFYPGTTRFTATPCDPATGQLLPLASSATAGGSAASASTGMVPQSLPVTGAGEIIQSSLAAVLLAIGVVLVRVTRRPVTR